jgi:hypothetical protein
MSNSARPVDKFAYSLAAVVDVSAASAASRATADSLSPHVIGGVKDSSPQDGIGDTLDDAPFIANVTGGEYRAIVEYDVSAPPRGTVLSASLTGWGGLSLPRRPGAGEGRWRAHADLGMARAGVRRGAGRTKVYCIAYNWRSAAFLRSCVDSQHP